MCTVDRSSTVTQLVWLDLNTCEYVRYRLVKYAMSLIEVRRCYSVRMIPLMLVDQVFQSIHISLVDKNGELRNINTFMKPSASGELFEASDFKDYSVITESDYVWEVNNDDGGYTALSPEADTKLKLLSQHTITAEGLPPTFLHDGDHFTVDFSRMRQVLSMEIGRYDRAVLTGSIKVQRLCLSDTLGLIVLRRYINMVEDSLQWVELNSLSCSHLFHVLTCDVFSG